MPKTERVSKRGYSEGWNPSSNFKIYTEEEEMPHHFKKMKMQELER